MERAYATVVTGGCQDPSRRRSRSARERADTRASYDWEYSTDGGKTWVAMPSTLQSKTSMTGLASGTTVQFRSCPVTKAGQGDWSAPVSLTVP